MESKVQEVQASYSAKEMVSFCFGAFNLKKNHCNKINQIFLIYLTKKASNVWRRK